MLGCLIGVGLLVRLLRQPTIAGTYDGRLDELLYAGQRLLEGQLLYDGLVNGSQPLAQLLYAPSAWLGSLTAHRLVILAVNLLGGILLGRSLRRLGAAGLILLRPDSLVPLLGGVLFLVFGQMFPGGLSGQPVQFANAFLVLALHGISGLLLERPDRSPRRDGVELATVGAALGLAVACNQSLASPLLMVVVVVLLLVPRPLPRVVPLLAGGLAAVALAFLPYAVLPGGVPLAWAGAVQLPLELAGRRAPEGDRLLPLLGDVLATNVAGLPIWLLVAVPALGLLNLTARQWRQPFQQVERVLVLPALALVFVLELLLSLQRTALEKGDLQLVVLPVLLVMACGFGDMEVRPRTMRRIARVVMVAMLLIVLNNTLIASLLNAPRRPKAPVLAVEADRAAVRRYLAGLAPSDRRFTAPQDVALQRQLRQPATTVGIGPEWSLNQQGLAASWATRRLGLPTSIEGVCRQLTDQANRHLVWMRTDPVGPNTEAFLLGCLGRPPRVWQDISDQLGLSSGQYRVFRRLAPQPRPAVGTVQPSS
ncbi:hypothetical protein NZK33_05920 [Cyanobium sp. FGCU-6]|nr:hypothetical protein [Cyanobium sp. FGCU6]